eukprot:288913_1
MSSRSLSKPTSGKYRRISIELEEPPNTTTNTDTSKNPLSNIKNSTLTSPKTQSKSHKSIGNYSQLDNTYTLENNPSTIINSNNKNEINNTSDTDNASEEDSKTEDEDLTPLPSHSIPNISNNNTNSNTKSTNKHCIYNFELNQKKK